MNKNNNKRVFQYGNVNKYIKNKRINKGIDDQNITDSNSGVTGIMIHFNSNPSDLARFYKELDIKTKSLNGEVNNEARDLSYVSALGISEVIPDNVILEKVGVRPAGPANAANARVYDLRLAGVIKEYGNNRSTYLDAVTKAKAIVRSMIHSNLEKEIFKDNLFALEFNNKTGSFRTFLNVFDQAVKRQLEWAIDSSMTQRIIQDIKELQIRNCECDAQTYIDRINENIILYSREHANQELVRLAVNQIEDPAAREIVENSIRNSAWHVLDANNEVMLSVYNEIMNYGLDDKGYDKFSRMMKDGDISVGETPFTKRTNVNNVITGGLKNMLEVMGKTVKRIKKENPTKSVYYVRVTTNPRPEPNWKNTSKEDKKDLNISAANFKKVEDKIDESILRTQIDYKNKDPSKEPCFYCRDVLAYLRTCSSHCYNKCNFNFKGNDGNKKFKRSEEQVKSLELKRKSERDELNKWKAQNKGRHGL